MSFRTAIVLSVVFHLVALALVYYLPRQQPPEPEAPYIVQLLGPAEQGPEPTAPPPEPRGIPEPPASPSSPPAPPSPPQAEPPAPVSPAPAPSPAPEAAPVPTPGPETGTPSPTETPAPPGEEQPPTPSTGRKPGPPGVPRPADIQEIIDQIAKAPSPSETKGAGITFDTKEFRYRAYMERLKEKIEGVWVYPRSAAEKGIYGDLIIQFTIRKDGSLVSAKVVRTSGHQELDKAAVQALREGEPYWPLPAGWEEDSLTINGHFIYTLWGSYLR